MTRELELKNTLIHSLDDVFLVCSEIINDENNIPLQSTLLADVFNILLQKTTTNTLLNVNQLHFIRLRQLVKATSNWISESNPTTHSLLSHLQRYQENPFWIVSVGTFPEETPRRAAVKRRIQEIPPSSPTRTPNRRNEVLTRTIETSTRIPAERSQDEITTLQTTRTTTPPATRTPTTPPTTPPFSLHQEQEIFWMIMLVLRHFLLQQHTTSQTIDLSGALQGLPDNPALLNQPPMTSAITIPAIPTAELTPVTTPPSIPLRRPRLQGPQSSGSSEMNTTTTPTSSEMIPVTNTATSTTNFPDMEVAVQTVLQHYQPGTPLAAATLLADHSQEIVATLNSKRNEFSGTLEHIQLTLNDDESMDWNTTSVEIDTALTTIISLQEQQTISRDQGESIINLLKGLQNEMRQESRIPSNQILHINNQIINLANPANIPSHLIQNDLINRLNDINPETEMESEEPTNDINLEPEMESESTTIRPTTVRRKTIKGISKRQRTPKGKQVLAINEREIIQEQKRNEDLVDLWFTITSLFDGDLRSLSDTRTFLIQHTQEKLSSPASLKNELVLEQAIITWLKDKTRQISLEYFQEAIREKIQYHQNTLKDVQALVKGLKQVNDELNNMNNELTILNVNAEEEIQSHKNTLKDVQAQVKGLQQLNNQLSILPTEAEEEMERIQREARTEKLKLHSQLRDYDKQFELQQNEIADLKKKFDVQEEEKSYLSSTIKYVEEARDELSNKLLTCENKLALNDSHIIQIESEVTNLKKSLKRRRPEVSIEPLTSLDYPLDEREDEEAESSQEKTTRVTIESGDENTDRDLILRHERSQARAAEESQEQEVLPNSSQSPIRSRSPQQ